MRTVSGKFGLIVQTQLTHYMFWLLISSLNAPGHIYLPSLFSINLVIIELGFLNVTLKYFLCIQERVMCIVKIKFGKEGEHRRNWKI